MKTWGALLLLACVAAPFGAPAGAQPTFMAGASPLGDFVLRSDTFLDRRFAEVVRQRYDFSCGSAALATLLRYGYGYRVREDNAFRGMWAEGDREQIRRLGFSLLDMKRWLESEGLAADGYKVSLEEVAATGLPGIAMVTTRGYRHFVVVRGVTAGEVLVADPSAGVQIMDRERIRQGLEWRLFRPQRRDRTRQAGLQSRAAMAGLFPWAGERIVRCAAERPGPGTQHAVLQGSVMYRRAAMLLLGAAGFLPGGARALPSPFAKPPVSDSELGAMRGGFSLGGGVEVAFAVQTETRLNGATLLLSEFRMSGAHPRLDVFVPRAAQSSRAEAGAESGDCIVPGNSRGWISP